MIQARGSGDGTAEGIQSILVRGFKEQSSVTLSGGKEKGFETQMAGQRIRL